MVKRSSFTLLIIVLLALLPLSSAAAATGADITMTVGCDGFTVTGGSITFEDASAVTLRAVDAAGTTLFTRNIARPDSGSYTFPSETVGWSTAPAFSPIIVSVETVEENAVQQELVFLVVGGCGSLPALANAFVILADFDLLSLFTDIDGSTADSVPLNTAPPRPVTDEADLAGLPGYAVVNTDNLNVRSGPGVEYTQVAVVDGGTVLIVLGRSADDLADESEDLWWYVEVGGVRGWVNSALLALRGDLSYAPVVEPQGELIPPSAYVGWTGTLLYSDPSIFGPVVCGIVGDVFYPVIGRDAAPANYYLIEATCEDGRSVEGWLPLESLIYRNDGGVVVPVVGE
jgi:uncharacterized protein YgiM (DUF1202 family)